MFALRFNTRDSASYLCFVHATTLLATPLHYSQLLSTPLHSTTRNYHSTASCSCLFVHVITLLATDAVSRVPHIYCNIASSSPLPPPPLRSYDNRWAASYPELLSIADFAADEALMALVRHTYARDFIEFNYSTDPAQAVELVHQVVTHYLSLLLP